MRLIDADVLKQDLTRFYDNEVTAKRLIDEQPTIEPCEDAISRQAVINAIANTCFWLSSDNWEELVKCIDSISPVNPQEPFKPMVEIDLYSVIKQKYIEREVLDKIRAEIERKANSGQWSEAVVYGMKKAIVIIDKHKAESEE